jgi:hypothetical protein
MSCQTLRAVGDAHGAHSSYVAISASHALNLRGTLTLFSSHRAAALRDVFLQGVQGVLGLTGDVDQWCQRQHTGAIAGGRGAVGPGKGCRSVLVLSQNRHDRL